MPTVPTYNENQVRAQPLTPMRIDPSAASGGATMTRGKQMEQIGQGMQQIGDAGARIATDLMREANQVRVIEADNKARERLYDLLYAPENGALNQRGVAALERPNGEDFVTEYSGKFREAVNQISGELANDAQRRMFLNSASQMATQAHATLTRHLSSELSAYKVNVLDGAAKAAADDIARIGGTGQIVVADRESGETNLQQAHARLIASTKEKARLVGMPQNLADVEVKRVLSSAHQLSIAAAVEKGNVDYAQRYFSQYKGEMTAGDLLAAESKIDRQSNAQKAMAAAQSAERAFAQAFEPDDASRLLNIRTQLESGKLGDFTRDGSPVRSKAGALYRNQVMPATAKNPGFGIRPADESGTPEQVAAEYNRVGDELLSALIQRYGNAQHALAAYNAGHGAVDAAISKAARSAKLAAGDPKVPALGWLDFLPAETKAYVSKGMELFNAGVAPSKPTELDFVNSAVKALGANPPIEQVKMTTEEARRRYSLINHAIKQRDDEAVATAMRAVERNGGHYSALPDSIKSAIPIKEVDNVIGFAQKIAKGDDTTSLWLYNKLTNDRGYLGSLSDNQFYALRRELSEADFKHFSAERAKLSGAVAGSNGPGDLNSSAIKQALDERLRMFRMDPTPKDGSSDAAHIGAMRKFVNDYFVTAQREAGKKFSDAEVVQHVDALFARNTTMRGFFSNSSGPMLGMKTGDIPSTDRDALKAAFKRRGVDDPTDAQILNAYWTLKIAKR